MSRRHPMPGYEQGWAEGYFQGITSGPMEPHEFLAYLVRLEFAALADDLDYYASKSEPCDYAMGLREAAAKIRAVLNGKDPHDADDKEVTS